MGAARVGSGQPPMHETRHGLDRDTRRSIVTMLDHRLADASDLYSQTKHAHWNVKGMGFYQLHLLFDELAEMVEKQIDDLAERAAALGGSPSGTVRMVSQNSSLEEFPRSASTDRDYVEAIAERFARHAKNIGEGIDRAQENGDRATSDLLSAVARDLDKAVYLLESHLQGNAGAR